MTAADKIAEARRLSDLLRGTGSGAMRYSDAADVVAGVADLADAQAQENAKQARRIEAMESALGWIALMPHSDNCSSLFDDEDFPCDCHVAPADAALGETP